MRSALALGLLAASASAASAGTYVGLGIGTGPAMSGDTTLHENGRSGRLELGYRFGRLSIAGTGSHAGIDAMDWGYTTPDATWTSLGVAGKYNLPLGDNFELFGRLGYQRAFVSVNNDPRYGDDSLSGGGVMFGGGVEYRINLGLTAASIFMDYTVSHSNLTSPEYTPEWGLTTRVWTLGAILSL